jgi:hypothetical protein
LRGADKCASIVGMNGIPPQLRTLIESAIADGRCMDDIEHDVISPANLQPEDHDAVWLYALGRSERRQRHQIRIISG